MEHPIRAQYSKTDISTAWPIPSIWRSALEMGGLRAFSHDPEPEFVHQMHERYFNINPYYSKHKISAMDLNMLVQAYDHFKTSKNKEIVEFVKSLPEAPTIVQDVDAAHTFKFLFRQVWSYSLSKEGPVVYHHPMSLDATLAKVPDFRHKWYYGNSTLTFSSPVAYKQLQLALHYGFSDHDGIVTCNSLGDVPGRAKEVSERIAERLALILKCDISVEVDTSKFKS